LTGDFASFIVSTVIRNLNLNLLNVLLLTGAAVGF
jgi:hypothetical protein